MSNPLEACPFCGGADISHSYVRDGRKMFCVGCGASITRFNGPNNDTVARLTEAWNRRTARSTVPEAGKAVVKPLIWDAIRDVVNEPWAKSTVRQSIGRHNLGPYAGSYSVQEITRDGDWGWWTTWEASREPQGIFKTEAEAKAAAQADFERRINSCLTGIGK